MTRGALGPTSQAADHGEFNAGTLDQALRDLSAKTSWWASQDPGSRAALLEATLDATVAASPLWLSAACQAKGLDPASSAAGEELFSGIGTFVRMAKTLLTSLRDLDAGRQPQFPGPVTEASDGRLVVGVFPKTIFDRILYAGTSAQVWMEAAVILKANPVNDYLVAHWSAAMAPLIDAGVVRIVTGGADAGSYLCKHDLVSDIHITGSDKTFDAIVFGTGETGASNKAASTPIIDKPVTGELGSVSPVIVVPGTWSDADILFQAEHVATMVANNAGFNCLTPRVLITWKHWPQRDAFLRALAQVLSAIPTREAYYPGAQERYGSFKQAHPDMLELGGASAKTLPWAIVEGLDPLAVDDICFNVEAFCSLTSETALDATDEAAFVDAAVGFANDVVWGSLSATILVHPTSLAPVWKRP